MRLCTEKTFIKLINSSAILVFFVAYSASSWYIVCWKSRICCRSFARIPGNSSIANWLCWTWWSLSLTYISEVYNLRISDTIDGSLVVASCMMISSLSQDDDTCDAVFITNGKVLGVSGTWTMYTFSSAPVLLLLVSVMDSVEVTMITFRSSGWLY